MPAIEIRESEQQREANLAVKDWLWRYRRAKLELRRLDGEYRELISVQEAASAVQYDGMPKASGNISDLSNLMIARDKMLTRLIRAKEEMTRAYIEITQAIDALDHSVERDIMSYRYIQLVSGYGVMDWKDIASRVGYSTIHVKRVHGIALCKLSKMILDDTK